MHKIPVYSNPRGVSLLGVVISIALVAGILMAVLQVVRVGEVGQRNLASRTQFLSVIRQVGIFLENPDSCRRYFEGKKFDPTASTLAAQVIPNSLSPAELEISFPSDSNRIFIEENSKINNNLVITDISLREFERIATGRYLAQLQIAAKLPKGLVVSQRTPVAFSTRNNSAVEEEILSCDTEQNGVPLSDVTAVQTQSAFSAIENCITSTANGLISGTPHSDWRSPTLSEMTHVLQINLANTRTSNVNSDFWTNSSGGFTGGRTLYWFVRVSATGDDITGVSYTDGQVSKRSVCIR